MYIVTGANGFIGSAIVWGLNQRGFHNIVAVDTISPTERPEPLQMRKYESFLKKEELLEYLSYLPDVDVLFHIGACSSTTERDRIFLKENNTDFSALLFQWCSEHGVPLIYASSASVYGDGSKGFSDETNVQELRALNPYGESKLEFDRWALSQSQVPPLWYGLRYFNVFGPGEYHKGEMSSVVYKAYQQISEKGSLRLFRSHRPEYQDGMQLRDFIYIKDIVDWTFKLIEKKPQSGIYNMGFGKARSWLDLARSVFSSMGVSMKIEWIDMPDEVREQYQYFTQADMTKSQRVGMNPSWSLEAGVDDYVKNYLLQGPKQI